MPFCRRTEGYWGHLPHRQNRIWANTLISSRAGQLHTSKVHNSFGGQYVFTLLESGAWLTSAASPANAMAQRSILYSPSQPTVHFMSSPLCSHYYLAAVTLHSTQLLVTIYIYISTPKLTRRLPWNECAWAQNHSCGI